MELFGRKVSIAILVSFVVGAFPTLAGLWQLLIHNWQVNPTLVVGAAITTVTALVHTWDTQGQ